MTCHSHSKCLTVLICHITQAKSNGPGSRCSSTSSLNSLASDALTPSLQNGRNHQISEWNENTIATPNQLHPTANNNNSMATSLTAKSPLREQQQQVGSNGTALAQKALISGERAE